MIEREREIENSLTFSNNSILYPFRCSHDESIQKIVVLNKKGTYIFYFDVEQVYQTTVNGQFQLVPFEREKEGEESNQPNQKSKKKNVKF